ncbi:hypothetical protein [Lederbergia lenta]|uniref:hypothetical protein n=1 Tax=Lederbergia lenta TaxID=1467 RepID=UPI00203CF1F6|nr:hypothetical protein [Lederbergia lenta]MCM3109546.1 hypothetical protein [Lederbergia lenta]
MTTYPVSVFIMDVSNSSKENMGEELSNYLQQLEKTISLWTKDIRMTKVIHRSGDELVVISSGYATAYTLAFYISRVWKFNNHKPYFGLSFGDIQNEVHTLNIETWIHPLMKQARHANDLLKQKGQNRSQFNFALDQFYATNYSENNYHLYRSEFELLINTILTLQQHHINQQTNIQSLVCSLFLILQQQNKVGDYIGRSASTISSHMKKGNCEEIIAAFNNIVQVMDSLQTNLDSFSDIKPQTANDHLQNNIKSTINKHIHDYFVINK